MKELTDVALEVARSGGATWADVRVVEERQCRVFVRRRSIQLLRDSESIGYGVRVLVDGAWGFASSTLLGRDDVARTAKRALEVSRASALVPRPARTSMAPEAAHVETLVGPCEEDPFAVPLSEQAELLLSACEAMLDVSGVASVWALLEFKRLRRIIANTDGSFLDLTTTFSNPHLEATAVAGSESQSCSYQGGARQAGFEHVRELDPVAVARRCAEDAVTKCAADQSPEGVMDLVLDPGNLSLTLHESVAHPTELDRILGWEANMAGRSFVRPEDVGSLRYGSELVNITLDNTLAGGVGSWFYDDDGVPSHKLPHIKEGTLVNLSTTRETVPLIGWERSNGCCRADRFDRFPINRNPNLYLEPGSDGVTPEELIAGVDRGVYVEGRGSFSIDQMRHNFQFGGNTFRMIEGGRLTRPLKNVTYQAQTTDFWSSCDGLAGPDHWQPIGFMNCGKGEPSQSMYMTHGASTTRFRGVSVGGARL